MAAGKEKKLSRRQFLRAAGVGALAVGLASCTPAPTRSATPPSPPTTTPAPTSTPAPTATQTPEATPTYFATATATKPAATESVWYLEKPIKLEDFDRNQIPWEPEKQRLALRSFLEQVRKKFPNVYARGQNVQMYVDAGGYQEFNTVKSGHKILGIRVSWTNTLTGLLLPSGRTNGLHLFTLQISPALQPGSSTKFATGIEMPPLTVVCACSKAVNDAYYSQSWIDAFTRQNNTFEEQIQRMQNSTGIIINLLGPPNGTQPLPEWQPIIDLYSRMPKEMQQLMEKLCIQKSITPSDYTKLQEYCLEYPLPCRLVGANKI